MPKLYDKESGRLVGTLSQADLDFLMVEFEEESSDDQDYYIDLDTLELLAEAGADGSLLTTLRDALAGRESCEVRWEAD